ncbi:MAG: hypothetical protein IAX22_00530 [Candidatus Bathyarchaeota archaeon]|nr:hypothetical protein [Candidatus Bathyarchaeota archaeon]
MDGNKPVPVPFKPKARLIHLLGDSGCFDEVDTSKACNNPTFTQFYKENGETFLKVVRKIPFKLTPYVIAEVSNLIKNGNFNFSRILDGNRDIIKEILLKSTEEQILIKDLFIDPIFGNHKDLGITDCVLMKITKEDLLLTHDVPLRDRAKQLGIKAMLPFEFLISI